MRKTNAPQRLKCSVCKRETAHSVARSYWHEADDILAYRRQRKCDECGCFQATYELPRDEFFKITTELSKLRTQKAAHVQLLAALKKKIEIALKAAS